MSGESAHAPRCDQTDRTVMRLSWKPTALYFLLSTAACAQTNPSQTSFVSNNPVINPNPQHVISVIIAAPTEVAIRLSANIQGSSNDNKCLMSLGLGVADRIEFRDYLNNVSQSTPKGQLYNLAVDKFLPGKCGWSLQSFNVEVRKNNMSGGIGFEYAPYIEKYGTFLTKLAPSDVDNSRSIRDIDVVVICKSDKIKNPNVVSGDYACEPTNGSSMPLNVGEHTRAISVTVVDGDLLRK